MKCRAVRERKTGHVLQTPTWKSGGLKHLLTFTATVAHFLFEYVNLEEGEFIHSLSFCF